MEEKRKVKNAAFCCRIVIDFPELNPYNEKRKYKKQILQRTAASENVFSAGTA